MEENCVPAGQCQSEGVPGTAVDCADKAKDYDSKFFLFYIISHLSSVVNIRGIIPL